MRIGRFEIVRSAAPAVVETDVKSGQEIGSTGTINTRGYLQQSEYNPKLRGIQGLKVFERMARSDSTVKEAEGHIFQPILASDCDIEPASNDPEHLEHAEFIRKAFFEHPVTPWETYLAQLIKFLRSGYRVFEIVEQVVEDELTIQVERAAGPPPETSEEAQQQIEEATAFEPTQQLEKRQFVTIRRFAERRPETIQEWIEKDGELTAVKQYVYDNDEEKYVHPEIPIENLIVATNEMEGNEYTGISLLRSAYKAWVMKELLEKISGVAYEMHGVGLLTVYLQQGVDKKFREEIEQMLKDLRAGEFHYCIFPLPKAQGNLGGITFEINSPDGGIPDFEPMLQYWRGEIKGSVLARFAELGHGQTGARSTGDTQSQVWYNALHAVARYIEDLHDPLIKRLIDKNYPDVKDYPRLKFGEIESKNLTEFADSLQKLSNAQIVKPDKPLRDWARRTVGAPDEDEVEAMQKTADQLRQQEREQALFEEAVSPETEPPKKKEAQQLNKKTAEL